MALTFLQLTKKVLSEEKRPLSATEIWRIAVEKGHDKLVGSTGKTPYASLGALLYIDIRDNSKSEFMSIGARPKRFFLQSQKDEIDFSLIITADTQNDKLKKFNYLEKDLHPLMVYYGGKYLKLYLKTINHNKENKKEFGEWIHPDIVGCYYPFKDWKDEVIEVSTQLSKSAIKIYSFELKRELNFGNLREAFFQAVSNSSWANEGYLVAAEIDDDVEFNIELTRLSSAFGIGVIKLNTKDPDTCETILPARTKDVVDWETVNKMTQNKDFSEFLKRIVTDTKSKEAHQDKYDPVYEADALKKMFAKR